MEGLLSRLYPDGDFSQEIDLEGWSRSFRPADAAVDDGGEHSKKESSNSSSSDDLALPTLPPIKSLGRHQMTAFGDPLDDDSDDDDYNISQAALVRSLRQICINPNPRRFYGKSSGIRLLREALDLKSEVAGTQPLKMRDVLSRGERRPDFWLMHPWERDRFTPPSVNYSFPDPDLLSSLVQIYFKSIAPLMPLLHRPTFMRDLQEGRHYVDDGFAGVVSLVCATGARYSHDPRVLLEDSNGHFHSAGWKWFNQVPLVRTSVLSAPSLHDLQITALAVQFLYGSSPPQACWTLCGVGLRLAQDVGAHRRRAYHGTPSVDDELWKRAFWVLHMLDIWMSSYLGRPCAISEENYDVELPADCDDEYWENEDPTLAFKQPAGKPSQTSFFFNLIGVNLIHSYALRTIYSINKSKCAARLGEQWEQRVVSDLDSALNKWFDSVPDHLRWDPARENTTHFLQSAALHAAYYYVQITIHRPFIPSFRKPSSLSFPSLAICANAARACSHVVDAQRRRLLGASSPSFQLPAFVSGVILLLSLWGAKRSGVTLDASREMEDVRKCMLLLESGETRWPVAGRLRDLLFDLSNIGELPLSQISPLTATLKRERGETSSPRPSDSSASNASQQVHTPPSAPPVSKRNIAGTRRVSAETKTASAGIFGLPTTNGEQYPSPTSPYSSSYHSPAGDSIHALAPVPGASQVLNPASPTVPDPFTYHSSPSSSSPPTYPPSSSLAHILGVAHMAEHTHAMNSAFTAQTYSSQMQTDPAQMPQLPLGQSFSVPELYDAGDQAGFMGTHSMENQLVGVLAPMVPQDGQVGVDSDTMMMWSTMPASFESDDWDTYLSNMVGLVNPQHAGQPQPTGQPQQHF
ncbi:hypothetical protein FA95DRAFT_1553663 [Auriscalpium vulgare]|uniref:Uncharacterized protein n=1 Tax=Auriscalpium vulgare TaxID=40419 RepID=A0ACB8S855_9AGAM|nr:hypothetical protein FA95DRAFT_1553663 [Auriscalpium vulgare]